ncbi:hypothetical protein BDD12DRAFT_882553 [Trichophaea hybrida]|nr:hypothetical protein BDD12DRAFT_882553 [Trichophaea hybrida]
MQLLIQSICGSSNAQAIDGSRSIRGWTGHSMDGLGHPPADRIRQRTGTEYIAYSEAPTKPNGCFNFRRTFTETPTETTKHIDVWYHNIRDLHTRKIVDYSNINTDENTADIFTNVLATDKRSKFTKGMGLQEGYGSTLYLLTSQGFKEATVGITAAHQEGGVLLSGVSDILRKSAFADKPQSYLYMDALEDYRPLVIPDEYWDEEKARVRWRLEEEIRSERLGVSEQETVIQTGQDVVANADTGKAIC